METLTKKEFKNLISWELIVTNRLKPRHKVQGTVDKFNLRIWKIYPF